MKRAFCSAAALAALGLALLQPVWAQTPAQAPRKVVTLQEMDANKDGKISKEEFLQAWTDKKAGEEAFNRLDTDKDGHITSLDLMGHFENLDLDKDGKVSLKEWSRDWSDHEAAAVYFKRMDINGDAFLAPQEYMGMWPGLPIVTW